MKLTRRAVSALLPAGLLAACSDVSRAPKRSLRDLIDGPAGHRAPAAGFVVIKDGEIIAAETVGLANGLSEEERSLGIEPRPFTPQTPFRAASISKLAVAMCCEGLHQMAAFDLDGDIRDHLDWMPRHPAFPDITITPRMLLSHTAGTRDPEAYWVPLPGQIQDIVSPDLFASPSRPGSWFEYCNLNYGLVATALEQATGQRFDRLVRAMVLAPLGLEGGFNWSDTDTPYRTNGATLYRETAEGWQIQMDGPDILNDRAPLVLKDEGAALSLYTPGTNGTLFSPQGGLRANLVELAQLANSLTTVPNLSAPLWTLNEARDNGEHDRQYYAAFGSGIQTHAADRSIWPGQHLIGHHGEAYGLYAGAWYAPDLDLSFAYAATGTPEVPPARSAQHPSLDIFTEVLMESLITA